MIRELETGDSVELDLLVKQAEIKQTKTKKDFLSMELFDGQDSIQAIKWDTSKKPDKNNVVSVNGTVNEWNGNKQLQLKSVKLNKDADPMQFAPTADVNIELLIKDALKLINNMESTHLANLCRQVFSDYNDLWKSSPGAISIHHAHIAGTLKHSVDTAYIAKDVALHLDCSEDLVVAGALLHDLGKLWTYELDGAVIDYTDEGKLLEHIIIGVRKLQEYRDDYNNRLLLLLEHIIVSHHGKQEYGSSVTPRFLEAWIVHWADMIDSKANIITNANKGADKYTNRVWPIENQELLSQQFIYEVMNNAK